MSEYNIQMNKYNALNAGYDQLYPKPMKHANTHANGGTDPITPSDIGAYSKNETDTLLANNDPRQWGLGADSILIDSLDNALETGWYKSNGATPASGYWNCLTERFNSQSITQTAVEYDGYGALIARRMLSLGVFGPWEWVNPPLYDGQEYRTTERYTGKPVYCKVMSIAPSSFAGQTVQIPHGISNMDASISVDGYFTQAGGEVKRRLNASYYGGSSMNCQVMANMNGVYFEIGEDYLQLIKNAVSNIFVMLKYTKSTD